MDKERVTSGLLAGAGKACINPPASCFPFVPSAANAKASATPGRSEIHDDCHVRVLVLDNGESRFTLASFDLPISPATAPTKEIICSVTGTPEENILLCATHNHDYPFDYSSFVDAIYDGVRQAAAEAVAALRPARYGFGTGESHINMNRDFQTEDGNWTAYNSTQGYSDKTLAVIKIVDEENRLIAAVLNYSAHAVLATSHLDVDGKLKLSSDFPGYAAGYIERRYGNGAVVLWTSGASGDQNPLITPYLLRYEDDGYVIRERMPNGIAFQLIAALGGQHAIDAIRILKGIDADQEEMPIHVRACTVALPTQKAPEGADMRRNRLLVDHLVPYGPDGERIEGELVKMIDTPDDPAEVNIRLFQLGNIYLVCFGDELYSRLGSKIKQASPEANTVVMTLTSAGVHRGYILDRESADHNTFQSYGLYRPGACDDILISGVRQLFEER